VKIPWQKISIVVPYTKSTLKLNHALRFDGKLADVKWLKKKWNSSKTESKSASLAVASGWTNKMIWMTQLTIMKRILDDFFAGPTKNQQVN
jgi:hypothetical protein